MIKSYIYTIVHAIAQLAIALWGEPEWITKVCMEATDMHFIYVAS